ncbi:MAG: carboxyl transferase domain-containing protein [Dehalococcoidia bacterium]|jgi:acetyl/propionyl-CoA carboxylase alpha subunit/acetyl-CoA carboxylase carboxyltransferase component|nr:carboxyl transferase domain-containing protein [Dehalococcoidia bacterium]
MPPSSLLVANRGEIAIRVMQAAADLGIRSVAVFPADDADSLHTRKADEARPLQGEGVMAYLDVEQIIAVAKEAGCDAVHPGYGFLSENATFARRCAEEGITFVGPSAEMLELFGDKVRARAIAQEHGVPVLPGTSGTTTLEQVQEFFASLDEGEAMIIKAVGGGGGRGVRVVTEADEIEQAYKRCQSEAAVAFGNGDLYVEQLVARARHIEVQIAGDATGAVSHFGERDCSIQRRHQKVVEIAPSPALDPDRRQAIIESAVRLAEAVGYDNLGTFEFLVDEASGASGASGDGPGFAFIETNARLQVEHTVTEEVTGVDLVQLQLRVAGGISLAEQGLDQANVPAPRGFAMQVRVNMETMRAEGMTLPSGGELTAFEPPLGRGVRTDTFGYAGYRTSPRYDSLLAKVVASTPSPEFVDVVNRTDRALSEFRIEGLATNIPFLRAMLHHDDIRAGRMYTRFLDDHIEQLAASAAEERDRLHFELVVPEPAEQEPAVAAAPATAGVKVDPNDPLAVLAHGKSASRPIGAPAGGEAAAETADGTIAVQAPLQGTIVSIDVAAGDQVRAGQQVLVMESMKMEHEIQATVSGIVRRIGIAAGDTIFEGHPLLFIEEAEVKGSDEGAAEEFDLDEIRPDLREVLDRQVMRLDEKRPTAVARREATNQRTARANILDLCDDGTFVEYGPLVLANQSSRRSLQELIEKTPTDGMITGVGTINGDTFDEPDSRCVVLSYDYTVLAGTQGGRNHAKTDRLIDVAEKGMMPLVIFTEGGGGRPGDDGGGGGGSRTFARFATLSALVPMVGITSGRCFAGNASLLGCCDVIIATANSNIGMGGPAMIEGGGLGVFAPEEIGGMDVQVPSGVVDIAVEDEAEAVEVAKKYLSYFQGPLDEYESADQRLMRRIIPENRLRVYDIRKVIETLADTDSVLELRPGFGHGMVTALVRVEGRAMGIVANNPAHLGGAIDSDGSDKAARFMQICDAFDLPLLFLCDTPGIMVGPEIEHTALVRHSSRMFLTGANLDVPFFTIILRKAYGLGAIAMAGGSYKVPNFTVAWPTGEFGGMGLEGSVKLGYRDELAAIEDPEERTRVYEEMVARAYDRGKALNNATHFGVDDTIDPADSRHWVASMLKSVRPPPPRTGKKRPTIEGW